MLTSILLLLASVAVTGGAFVWGMCRAAHNGDVAMEEALSQRSAISAQRSAISHQPAAISYQPEALRAESRKLTASKGLL